MADISEKLQKEPQTEEDAKNLLKLLETEHRKAAISEETYKELKAKFKEKMKYLSNTITKEDIEKTKNAGPLQFVAEGDEEDKKKGSLFGKLLHHSDKRKKPAEGLMPIEEPEAVPEERPPSLESGPSAADVGKLGVELEKMKIMMDASREQKKSYDDSLRTAFESIGELRSMLMQNDANVSDISAKFERIEDDVSDVRPKEIDKKFSELSNRLNKMETSLEKLQTKTNDMAHRINKVHDLMKSIGGVENLIKVNENVQRNLDDVKEAMRYAERLASKTEKMFLEIKNGLDEMLVYKAKQESVENEIKDLTKESDSLETALEFYAKKEDIAKVNNDIMLLQRQIENINKMVPVLQSNVPEPIIRLRQERDDIKIFLESLETQFKSGKLKLRDYEGIKKKNLAKLKSLEKALEREWKSVEEMFRKRPKEEAELPEGEEKEPNDVGTIKEEKPEGTTLDAASEPITEEKKEEKTDKIEKKVSAETPAETISEEPKAAEKTEEIVEEKKNRGTIKQGKRERKETRKVEKSEKEKDGFLGKLRDALENATEKVETAKEAVSKEKAVVKKVLERTSEKQKPSPNDSNVPKKETEIMRDELPRETAAEKKPRKSRGKKTDKKAKQEADEE